jgi:hypothetical protein
MKCVDFSKAVLRGVNFDGVDLSTCTFPNDSRHLVLHDQNAVLRLARETISQGWTGMHQRDAIKYLDSLHLVPEPNSPVTEARLRQPIDVINLDDLKEYIGIAVGERLYRLLVDINSKTTEQRGTLDRSG